MVEKYVSGWWNKLLKHNNVEKMRQVTRKKKCPMNIFLRSFFAYLPIDVSYACRYSLVINCETVNREREKNSFNFKVHDQFFKQTFSPIEVLPTFSPPSIKTLKKLFYDFSINFSDRYWWSFKYWKKSNLYFSSLSVLGCLFWNWTLSRGNLLCVLDGII